MATRGRKAKPDAKTDSLLKALRFVALAQSNDGTIAQRHCILNGGWLAATDNVMTLGVKTADDLVACPQTKRFISALERCGEGVAITIEAGDRIRVASGALKVSIPCVESGAVALSWADPMIAPLDERFMAGLRTLGHLPKENGTQVYTASVLCRGGLMTATTGEVIIDYWHGLDTPPYWTLPAASIEALLKIDKKLVGFGFGGKSATFYFDDESWLRTQLFVDKWANTEKVFADSNSHEWHKLPPGFFDAVAHVEAFSETGFIRFETDRIVTVTEKQSDEAEIAMLGLPVGIKFRAKNLLLLRNIATHVAIGERVNYFQCGESARAAIASCR